MIGRVLSHYKILERIGRGGMGEVFLAEDTSLDRKVALKVLPEALSSNEERRQRFEREAKAVAALNHPNIVTIHSVEEAEGVHFITMELVQGKRLSEILPKGGMALPRFLELAVPITEGVSAAHEQGITHRDLKPDNIMVTDSGQPKILDFGLAKLRAETVASSGSELPTEGMTGEGRIVGTISHMSPEQAEGKSVDHRSDIFSLGVVFYEMLTGRRPFRGDSPTSVLSSILKDTPQPVTELNPEVPRDLAKLCRRCLAKDPTRRYQTALDLRNELEEIRQELDSGSLEPPVLPHPRGRLGMGIGLAVVLGIVAIGVLALLSLRDQTAPEALQIQFLTSFEGVERDPSWSPDGSLVAFSYAGPDNGGSVSSDLYVMPAAGGDPVRLTDGPADELFARWSPDNRHIAFASNRGSTTIISLIPTLGGPEKKLVDTHMEPSFERSDLGAVPWSPDGQELLFPRKQPSGKIALWKVTLETARETQLTDPPPGSDDLGATWSFDGARIAFTRSEGGRGSLWLLPARGGEPRALLSDEFNNMSPAWSVDGRRIVFTSNRAGPTGLWELEVDSGRLRQLVPNASGVGQYPRAVIGRQGKLVYDQKKHAVDLFWLGIVSSRERQLTSHTAGADNHARVSPDGQRVAYSSNRTANDEIWRLDLATGEDVRLTDHPSKDWLPDWSPDGREILFVSDREGSPRLWVMSPEGRSLRRLSEQAVLASQREGHPRFSPDGTSIGYLAPTDRGTALWVMDCDGANARSRLLDVLDFEWYLDSRHVVYSRMGEDGRELVAADLESGEETLLLDVPHVEHRVSPDGQALTYGDGVSHHNQQLYLLRLTPTSSTDRLPRPLGEPVPLTEGGGLSHTHSGGWSPDGAAVVYTRDTDNGDIYVIENYR